MGFKKNNRELTFADFEMAFQSRNNKFLILSPASVRDTKYF